MKTIIAGSRSIFNYGMLLCATHDAIVKGYAPTVIISGGAAGADALGERYARETKLPCEVFYAEWDKHGKSAGHLRNIEMARNAHFLIALWDGKSRGTADMIKQAQRFVLPILIYSTVDEPRWIL